MASNPKRITGSRFRLQRRYIFHILFWIMYAVFMILETQGYIQRKGAVFNLTPLLIYFILMAMLVYGNIKILVPLLLRKKYLLYILGTIFLIVAYTQLRSLNQQYWDRVVWPDEPMEIRAYYKWNLIYAVWFMIISSMLFYTQKSSEQEQKLKNIEINQLETELKYLRSQLNPHFLFNGLNTIYGNIDIRDQQARNILLQFSDLLRYSLYEAESDYVLLEKEARHLENFVALQRARSNPNVNIELSISIENGSALIAPLLFMPFVENAFKFGSREDGKNNFINLSLKQTPGIIEFRCINSFEEMNGEKGGIGLANVRRRLELLYKDQHQLEIRSDNEQFSVELILTK